MLQKLTTALLVSLSLLGGTSLKADEAKLADTRRLFVEATKAWDAAMGTQGNDLATLEVRHLMLERVKSNLTLIVEEYADTELAFKLVVGEKIGALSLAQVDEMLRSSRLGTSEALARCAEPSLCLETFTIRLGRSAADPSDRARILHLMAVETLSTELLREAETAAKSDGEEAYARWFPRAHRDFAYAQAKAGDIEGAILTAKQISDPEHKGYFYENLVTLLADRGEYSQALDIARSPVDVPVDRARMFGDIATAQARAGNTGQSIMTVGAIDDEWRRALALEDVTVALLEAGMFHEASMTLKEIDFRSPYARTLARVAVETDAPALLEAALVEADGITDERARGWAYQSIADAQIEMGLFEDAANTLIGIGWQGGRDAVTRQIAVAQTKAGLHRDAQVSIARIQDTGSLDAAFAELAVAQAEAGEIALAEETARSIREPSYAGDALYAIAVAYAQAGRITEALQIAQNTSSAFKRADALVVIALAMIEEGDPESAMQLARSRLSGRAKAIILREIAGIQAQVGDLAGAIATALEHPDPLLRSRLLIDVSERASS